MGAPTSATGRVVARVADGLSSVGAADWDALVPPGSRAVSHEYLTAWENSDLPRRRSRPVVAYEPAANRPVAACAGYSYDIDLLGTRVPAAAGLLRMGRRLWPKLLMARTYELGSPAPLTNPFLVADGWDRAAAVGALVEAALAEAERDRAQFMIVQNLPSLDVPAARQLTALGFSPLRIMPTVVVDLPYRSFDEYLAAMRSQYRRRARQAFDRSAHLRFEHLDQFADLAPELSRLWHERAGELKHETLTPGYFRAVSGLDDASVLLARRPDGSIAAFALLLADRPWLAFLHCGFTAEAASGEGAYFRLLYEIVRLGIEGGYQQVDLGMTTVEPKLDVGGVPVPLFALIRHRRPTMHRAIRTLAALRRPERRPPRRVFKQDPPPAAELVARRQLLG